MNRITITAICPRRRAGRGGGARHRGRRPVTGLKTAYVPVTSTACRPPPGRPTTRGPAAAIRTHAAAAPRGCASAHGRSTWERRRSPACLLPSLSSPGKLVDAKLRLRGKVTRQGVLNAAPAASAAAPGVARSRATAAPSRSGASASRWPTACWPSPRISWTSGRTDRRPVSQLPLRWQLAFPTLVRTNEGRPTAGRPAASRAVRPFDRQDHRDRTRPGVRDRRRAHLPHEGSLGGDLRTGREAQGPLRRPLPTRRTEPRSRTRTWRGWACA